MDTPSQSFRVIGRRTPKVDAIDEITGRAQFGADVTLPRLLVGDDVLLPSVSLTDILQRLQHHPCWTMPLTEPNQGRGMALGTVDLSATRTSLAVVAAEALGLKDVGLVMSDTDMVAYSGAGETFSSVATAPDAAAHMVNVEVDGDTGQVKILRYTTFQDGGLCVNPDQVEGRMQGGATQGIG